jgi:group I intron endonuclease
MKISYDLKNKAGVYMMYGNGHYYVGSSKNIYIRLKEHKNSLKRCKHYNQHLQRVYSKYGEESLNCCVLEFCDNYVEREAHYIACLKPNINVEQDPISRIKSEVTKLKLSIANTGKRLGEDNHASRTIHQYTKEGVYVASYPTLKAAALAVGLNGKTMHKTSIGNTKTLGGYMWSFKKVKKLKAKAPKKPSNVKYKKIILVSDTETLTVKSINEAAFLLKVSVQSIHQAAKKNKTCKGYLIKLN